MATAAARAALGSAGVNADRLSVIVVATSTPDRPQPLTAVHVQHALGAYDAAAFDVNAVCSGSVFALATAEAMLARFGGYGLVIGADVYSRILAPADRRTAVLFGDGAGAMVLGPSPRGSGIRHCSLHTFGE
ncbi:3-oxoacyl-ACP synthase III family protein [Streptomyces sp. MUM 178J]|uniref:3-oxoacyl-ACP synthase III family protein n=1 Tax=Streptomyces sp. MUM 178J TaxID=2791991 RepID=UPI003FA759D3